MFLEIILFVLFARFSEIASVNVDIVADNSTAWAAPASVSRCPLHRAFEIKSVAGAGISFKPPGGGKFSVAQKQLPVAARLNRSTGLILRYTSPPGASGVSLWRIRVNSAADHHVRFVHLFSIPANGVTNETRYMPWADFTGQIMQRNSGIQNCSNMQNDTRCTLKPENITHVSFLESEDTVAHEILLHSLIVTTDPIAEQNPVQHHTQEAAALLWEREHHAMNIQKFVFNGTHYVIGGNCSSVCKVTTTSLLAPQSTTTSPPAPQSTTTSLLAPQSTTTSLPAPQNTTALQSLQAVASAAQSITSHFVCVAAVAAVTCAARARF